MDLTEILRLALIVLIAFTLLRIFWPVLVIGGIGYGIYYFIQLRKYKKMMNEVNEARETFQQSWDDVTSSQAYQNGSSDDIIDAEYIVKEESNS